MWNMFAKVNKNNCKEKAKQEILKEFFNSADQKKAVIRAARESAKDQDALVKKYHELKLRESCR